LAAFGEFARPFGSLGPRLWAAKIVEMPCSKPVSTKGGGLIVQDHRIPAIDLERQIIAG
jgi:hypothetical protein